MVPGWLEEMEREVRACVRDGEQISAKALALRLGVSRDTALYYITLLACTGAVTVERVALRPPVGGGEAAA